MEPANFEHLPTTRKDIEWYLITWLKPLKPGENPQQYTIDGRLYCQIMGFRRGFCVHAVFREINGESYAFSVTEDTNTSTDYDHFEPNMGTYKSFAELLSGVTELYYQYWNRCT